MIIATIIVYICLCVYIQWRIEGTNKNVTSFAEQLNFFETLFLFFLGGIYFFVRLFQYGFTILDSNRSIHNGKKLK